MTEKHNIQLWLSTVQYNKYVNKKPFQLSFNQLQGAQNGTHEVELEFTKKEHNKIRRNIKHQKGYRVQPHNVVGGSLLRKIKNTFKKVGHFIKHNVSEDGLNTAANLASGVYAGVTGDVVGAMAGNQLAKRAISSGYDLKNKVDFVNGLKDQAIGNAHNFSNGLRDQAQQQVNHYANQAQQQVNHYANQAQHQAQQQANHYANQLQYQGNQYRNQAQGYANQAQGYANQAQDWGDNNIYGGKLKLVKGSAEAKAHMAKLRGMRKGGAIKFNAKCEKTEGGSLASQRRKMNRQFGRVANDFKYVVSVLQDTAANTVDVARANIRPAISSGLGTVVSPAIDLSVYAALDKANIGIGFKRVGKLRMGGKCKGGSFLPIGK